jgi:chemotaxis protein MotB
MADEEQSEEGAAGEDGGDVIEEPVKCPICVPGLPAWMATFSDLVTLLLTFFVLLLSFAKTESAKYEAALGSIRNAFGGNVFKYGEVIQRGKSPDDAPTMMDAQEPVKPFPIEFLTMEGMLDKHEINRNSDESLNTMKKDLKDNNLAENVDVYEMSEGIKVMVKDKIYFEQGTTVPSKLAIKVFDRVVKMLSESTWTVYVMGHAFRGESSKDGKLDAFELSSKRAAEVARSLIKRGVSPGQVVTSFFGDTRPVKVLGVNQKEKPSEHRRVEFMIRKRDLGSTGNKVDSM